jgi:hypothetical protein
MAFFRNMQDSPDLGHNHLLEIRLLEKSAQHDFIIARHHSSNNIFLVNCSKIKNYEKYSAVGVFRAVSLLDKKILTARIAIGRQRF